MTMMSSQIKHIVYLMLENRSFDNVLGWLYSDQSPPAHVIDRDPQCPRFYGLTENTYFNRFTPGDTPHYVTAGVSTMDVPDPDPYEEYEHVNVQLFGTAETPLENTPMTMCGFLADYAVSRLDNVPPHPILIQADALKILQTYTPEQLPVLSGLARAYAVSDQWFSSVPTQTNCNRAFSVCGTSLGQVNNKGLLGDEGFDTRTLWNVLYENGRKSVVDWAIFYQEDTLGSSFSLTRDLFPQIPDPDTHFLKMDAFFQAAEQGLLPTFSYLEPAWFEWVFGNGNDYHPSANLPPGEVFVKKVYDALTGLSTGSAAAKEAWENTLLIISFDEHGGTYDHIAPPWGAAPPWGNTPPPVPLEQGFQFNRFGVRVPTLLISPWVEAGTVFRSMTDVPYDHTSSIATILTWFGITDRHQWKLGERTRRAPTFDNVLTRTAPREDIPTVNSATLTFKSPYDTPLNSLQIEYVSRLLRSTHRDTQGMMVTKVKDIELREINSLVSRCSSVGDLQDAVKNYKPRGEEIDSQGGGEAGRREME